MAGLNLANAALLQEPWPSLRSPSSGCGLNREDPALTLIEPPTIAAPQSNRPADLVERRLDAMFALQAMATPNAAAIYFLGRVISYEALAAQVDALALDLARHGVGPGVIVALAVGRSPATIALILAILQAGGAYLPLDARSPPERSDFILADSGAGLLVVDAGRAAPAAFAGVVLELSEEGLTRRGAGASARAQAPAGLAYVIYTSGSTGAPKGVMLGHSATHLVDWARNAFDQHARSRMAATTSFSFDPSIFEIFVPLCTGGALVLKGDALEPFADDERPTMLCTVPSVLTELCRTRAVPPSLAVLNVGGEALSRNLAQTFLRAHPEVKLYNHYGPTEATTCAAVAQIRADQVGEPPIGRPVRGAQILLRGRDGAPVAEGDSGEIHIGGPGLALGYLNRPALTRERFVQLEGLGRFYRTGDLGRWRDGQLRFEGRLDRQVKIRGFRVELGEVEAALLRLTGVERAVVGMAELAGRSQMVGYVQAPEGAREAALREGLRAWLPDYMVPVRLVVVDAFPLLPSGKLDQAALQKCVPASAGRNSSTASAAEAPIVRVFEEILGRAGLGPEDSFFELGGDSLSSVWAALRLGEVLGFEVPAALIHQAPSARALAGALVHGQVRAAGHVGLLAGQGAQPPLFCMADIFGHAFNYLSLARRLGAQRPVYGVTPGPLQDSFTRSGDIAALAQAYAGELAATAPGPYLIAGYSAGGLLAVETAAALERAGHGVRLVLLDSSLHSGRASRRPSARWIGEQVIKSFEPRGRQRKGDQPAAWAPRSQAAFAATMIKAGLRFQPSRFHGPSLVVRASERGLVDRIFDQDGLLGWSQVLLGPVERTTVSGGHHDFLREPRVAEAASAVQRFIGGDS